MPTSKWYSRGAAGFAAAAPDPTNAQELPRLYIQREDGKGGDNYVPLAERLDIDHLLAALRTHGEEWEHMMPKGDRQTIYKKEPWNHSPKIRIWVKTSVGRLSRGTHHLQEGRRPQGPPPQAFPSSARGATDASHAGPFPRAALATSDLSSWSLRNSRENSIASIHAKGMIVLVSPV